MLFVDFYYFFSTLSPEFSWLLFLAPACGSANPISLSLQSMLWNGPIPAAWVGEQPLAAHGKWHMALEASVFAPESVEPQLPPKNSFNIYSVEILGNLESLVRMGRSSYFVSIEYQECSYILFRCWFAPTAPERPALSGNVHMDTSSVEKTVSCSSGGGRGCFTSHHGNQAVTGSTKTFTYQK